LWGWCFARSFGKDRDKEAERFGYIRRIGDHQLIITDPRDRETARADWARANGCRKAAEPLSAMRGAES